MTVALDSKQVTSFQSRSPRSLIGLAILGAAFMASACEKKNPSETEAQAQFAQTCARCHGTEGTGGVPAGVGAPAPRNFHDATFQATRTDEDIHRTISRGKPPGMPAFAGMFSDAQIRGLVGVVRSFDPSQQKAGSSPLASAAQNAH